MVQHHFEVPFTSKAIHCVQVFDGETDAHDNVSRTDITPSLIFTHGAGGTLTSDGIANFSVGFAKTLPILCFQGNMNLKSRVKMFSAVIENQNFATYLGGRSMGARAAVMAATEDTKLLILASYPLHTDKETRDQILLDIEPSIDVLFVEGDKDSMCDLSRLEAVRKEMKCKTWLAVVEGADHGMTVSPRTATAEVGSMTGEIAAKWIKDRDNATREGRITWDEGARWSGWTQDPFEETEEIHPEAKSPKKKTQEYKRKEAKMDASAADERISRRPRKRRKI